MKKTYLVKYGGEFDRHENHTFSNTCPICMGKARKKDMAKKLRKSQERENHKTMSPEQFNRWASRGRDTDKD